MTTVVPESDRVSQRHVDADFTCDGCRDLRHFECVGQPGALVVAWKHDNLCLPGQAPERSGVHNPIAVTLETGALVIRLLGDGPTSRSLGKCGSRAEHRSFTLLTEFPMHNWSRTGAGLGTWVGAYEILPEVTRHGVSPCLGAWRDFVSHRRCPAPLVPDQDHNRSCHPASHQEAQLCCAPRLAVPVAIPTPRWES
jgi:hypothetical protein